MPRDLKPAATPRDKISPRHSPGRNDMGGASAEVKGHGEGHSPRRKGMVGQAPGRKGKGTGIRFIVVSHPLCQTYHVIPNPAGGG